MRKMYENSAGMARCVSGNAAVHAYGEPILRNHFGIASANNELEILQLEANSLK